MKVAPQWSNNLKSLRNKMSKTQAQLGLHIGKGQRIIANWENNVSEPSIEDWEKLSQFFGITVHNLMFSDLSKGNLTDNSENAENGNLKGNVKGNLTKNYEQNDAVSMANEHAPPGVDYKQKYLALLEKLAGERNFITEDVFERTLRALNARHAAFQEYVLSALSRLEKEGSFEERAAEVHKMMIQKLNTAGTLSVESI